MSTSTNNESKHTPLPWHLGQSSESNPHNDFVIFGPDFGSFSTGSICTVSRRASNDSAVESFSPHMQRLTAEANAALIVRAVNSHQELVSALTNLIKVNQHIDVPAAYEDVVDPGTGKPPHYLHAAALAVYQAKIALARAGGGE